MMRIAWKQTSCYNIVVSWLLLCVQMLQIFLLLYSTCLLLAASMLYVRPNDSYGFASLTALDRSVCFCTRVQWFWMNSACVCLIARLHTLLVFDKKTQDVLCNNMNSFLNSWFFFNRKKSKSTPALDGSHKQEARGLSILDGMHFSSCPH